MARRFTRAFRKVANELSLEGKPAPALAGMVIPKGKPALLFFWAHWCPDCKAEIPDLKKLKAEFVPKGLVFLAPTQKYGYAAGGQGRDAGRERLATSSKCVRPSTPASSTRPPW